MEVTRVAQWLQTHLWGQALSKQDDLP